jgi:hypothetical protein
MVDCPSILGSDGRRGVRPCGKAGGWMAHGQGSAHSLWEAFQGDRGPSLALDSSPCGRLRDARRAPRRGLVGAGPGLLKPVSEEHGRLRARLRGTSHVATFGRAQVMNPVASGGRP